MTNPIKTKLQNKETVFGTWCMLPSANVVNAVCSANLDFVIIDLEHGPMSYETVENMVRAAETKQCAAIVRAPECNESTILRALEVGVHGVLVPHIETAELAKQAVQFSKYHPEGRRGLSPYTRVHDYDHADITKKLQTANDNLFVGIMVEGQEGLSNLEAIAATPGIDMIFFGVNDISQSIGLPGQVWNPKVVETLQKYSEYVNGKNIATGTFCPTLDFAKTALDAGCRFISYTVDSHILKHYYEQAMTELRAL